MNSTQGIVAARGRKREVGRAAVLLFAAGVALAAAPPARADFIARFTNQHVDVDLRFEMGQPAIGWHDETNDIEYEADEALVLVGTAALRSRPASAAFNFLGVGLGAPVWVLPQVQDPNLVFLGIGTEEIDPGIFQNDEVTLSLVGIRGPGFFSLWTTDAFGSPTPLLTTADGITTADRVVRPIGSHQDFNWGFTVPGFYELDFQLSGVLLSGQPVSSEVTTLSFSVVPEPASCSLLAVGTAAMLCYARRRRST
ncbi:MAG TPA: choice-of-anchor M domain-containing protein [Gemmataceae bacterium]|nr:choice-of-anchor M domain-containing protein [Gemmataceae bacterium]